MDSVYRQADKSPALDTLIEAERMGRGVSKEQTKTRFEWAKEIRPKLGKTVEAVLEVGRSFLAAKAVLPPREFQLLRVDLRIGQRMWEMYMSIADNPVIVNPQHVAALPTSMSTLYILSRVKDLPRLEAAIANGQISPQLQREEARRIFSPQPARTEWSLAECDDRLRNLINKERTKAPATERAQIINLLRQLADELEKNAGLQDDAEAAIDDLEIHDAEPGGYRIFEDEMAAACHAGGPAVIGGVRSTHGDWYKNLSTKVDGATALDRKVIEHRLDDMRMGRAPTTRTRSSFDAVRLSIHGLGTRAARGARLGSWTMPQATCGGW